MAHFQRPRPVPDVGYRATGIAVLICLIAVLSHVLSSGAIYLGHLHYHKSFTALVTRFDGGYYRSIAASGYPGHLPVDAHGQVLMNPTAFFPLFPLAAGGIMRATGAGFAAAGLGINLVCLAVAAVFLAAIWKQVGERPSTALAGAVLWLLWPISYVASMTYGDALFSALAAAAIWCLLTRRWLLAGAAAALAGATRPTGVILVLCCLYAAAIAFHKERSVRPALALVISPVGILAYFGYLWQHTGRADAWFVTESQGWHVYFDGGIDNVERVGKYVREHNVVGLGLVVFVAICLVLLILLLRERTNPILAIWTVGIAVMAVTSRNDFSSVPRFLYPAFPLLLPVVRVLERYGGWAVTAFAVVSAAAMIAFGVYITGASHYPP